mmetsp:Transcript_12796/g.25955  ORF Transcript_12796/g.25955 Transcript_12796/m.25955 type:complete len:227 (+) Transcript_12796:30-710(+)
MAPVISGPKTEIKNLVRNVGCHRLNIVRSRLGVYTDISRDAFQRQGGRNNATFYLVLSLVSKSLCHLRMHSRFALEKADKSIDSTIPIVVFLVNFGAFEETQSGIRHYPLIIADGSLVNAVDFVDGDIHPAQLDLLRKCLPGGLQTLTVRAPPSIKVDKGKLVPTLLEVRHKVHLGEIQRNLLIWIMSLFVLDRRHMIIEEPQWSTHPMSTIPSRNPILEHVLLHV